MGGSSVGGNESLWGGAMSNLEAAVVAFRDVAELPTGLGRYEKDLQLKTQSQIFQIYRAKVPHEKVCQSPSTVVIKIFDLEKTNASGNADTLTDVQKEVAIMRRCCHPNIVELQTSFAVGSQLWMVLNYMNRGSCYDQIQAREARKKEGADLELGFRLPAVKWILSETLKALKYLHGQNMIHRDIKAQNILLDSKWDVKVTDFWKSSNLDGEKKKKVMTFVGSPCWMAPEVVEQEAGYDNKADIWSLGITTIELATGHTPFHNQKPLKVLKSILFSAEPRLPEKHDAALRDFVEKCLKRQPTQRPGAVQLASESTLLTSGAPLTRPSVSDELIDVHKEADTEQKASRDKGKWDSIPDNLDSQCWDISYETLDEIKVMDWSDKALETSVCDLAEQTRERRASACSGTPPDDLMEVLRELGMTPADTGGDSTIHSSESRRGSPLKSHRLEAVKEEEVAVAAAKKQEADLNHVGGDLEPTVAGQDVGSGDDQQRGSTAIGGGGGKAGRVGLLEIEESSSKVGGVGGKAHRRGVSFAKEEMEREFDWFSRQDNARPQASPDLQPSPTKGTLADFLPSITKGEDGSELSRADGAATTSSGGCGSERHQELGGLDGIKSSNDASGGAEKENVTRFTDGLEASSASATQQAGSADAAATSVSSEKLTPAMPLPLAEHLQDVTQAAQRIASQPSLSVPLMDTVATRAAAAPLAATQATENVSVKNGHIQGFDYVRGQPDVQERLMPESVEGGHGEDATFGANTATTGSVLIPTSPDRARRADSVDLLETPGSSPGKESASSKQDSVWNELKVLLDEDPKSPAQQVISGEGGDISKGHMMQISLADAAASSAAEGPAANTDREMACSTGNVKDLVGDSGLGGKGVPKKKNRPFVVQDLPDPTNGGEAPPQGLGSSSTPALSSLLASPSTPIVSAAAAATSSIPHMPATPVTPATPPQQYIQGQTSPAPMGAGRSAGAQATVQNSQTTRTFTVIDMDAPGGDMEARNFERRYRDMNEEDIDRMDSMELRQAMRTLQKRVKELEQELETSTASVSWDKSKISSSSVASSPRPSMDSPVGRSTTNPPHAPGQLSDANTAQPRPQSGTSGLKGLSQAMHSATQAQDTQLPPQPDAELTQPSIGAKAVTSGAGRASVGGSPGGAAPHTDSNSSLE